MSKQPTTLEEIITGRIYEAYRKDLFDKFGHDEVVYSGSTLHETLDEVWEWHAHGHAIPGMKAGKNYKLFHFRGNLRYPDSKRMWEKRLVSPFAENISLRWASEPFTGKYEDLLVMEREAIVNGKLKGHNYMNHHNDPVQAFKYNRGIKDE